MYMYTVLRAADSYSYCVHVHVNASAAALDGMCAAELVDGSECELAQWSCRYEYSYASASHTSTHIRLRLQNTIEYESTALQLRTH